MIEKTAKRAETKIKWFPAYHSRIGLFQAVPCLPVATLDMFACEHLPPNILKHIVLYIYDIVLNIYIVLYIYDIYIMEKRRDCFSVERKFQL